MPSKFRRYHRNDISSNRFYQMPKFLFSEEFTSLSNDSKVLYTLLRDRHELSMSNGWIDKKGNVYLIFTRDNMQELIRRSKPTVVKIMKELKDAHLLEEVQQGVQKPNLIYLNYYVENSEYLSEKTIEYEDKNTDKPHKCSEVKKLNFKRLKKLTSGSKNFLPQEVKKINPNKTDLNKTDFKEIYLSSCDEIDMESLESLEDKIKSIIEYDILCEREDVNIKQVDGVIGIITDTLLVQENSISIGKLTYPKTLVEKRLLSLDQEQLLEALQRMEERARESKINNIRGYTLATLFDTASTAESQNIYEFVNNEN